MTRFVPVAVCALLAAFAVPARVRADGDAGAIRATLACEHAAVPGRLRCDAELRTDGAGVVRWADVEVVKTPDFLLALKGRIGPRDATMREGDLWRWGLGIVARERGEGDVVTRIRAVVCHGETCAPVEATATSHVVVGS